LKVLCQCIKILKRCKRGDRGGSLLYALYYLGFALGGSGFSVPMGLLMAGVSVTSAFMRLLPRWVIVLGLVLAAAGEISSLHLAFPQLLFLIPLVRFPGFVWLIAVGFLLPTTRRTSAADPVAATQTQARSSWA